nr:anti-sigma-I factor RsgI2-like [Nothobranchius furzeri]
MAAVGVLLVLLQIVLLSEGSSLDGPKNLRAGDELQVKRQGLFPSDSALKKLFSVLEKGAKVPLPKVKRETNVTLLQCRNSTAAACSVVNGPMTFPTWPPSPRPMTFPTWPPSPRPMTFPTWPPSPRPMTFPTWPPSPRPMTFPTWPPSPGPRLQK